MLVLQTTDFGQPLRAKSGFVTVDTRKLAVIRTINLNGDFAYDAISPNGRTLYLIEHFPSTDVLRYRVRAYDLADGPPAAADHRRQARAERADERHAVGAHRDGGRPQGLHALRRARSTRSSTCSTRSGARVLHRPAEDDRHARDETAAMTLSKGGTS